MTDQHKDGVHLNSLDLSPAIALADRWTAMVDKHKLNGWQQMNMHAMMIASMAYNIADQEAGQDVLLTEMLALARGHLNTLRQAGGQH